MLELLLAYMLQEGRPPLQPNPPEAVPQGLQAQVMAALVKPENEDASVDVIKAQRKARLD